MRKLLSLLTVLTLSVPVPLNVIACGNKSTPPVADEPDYLTLAQTAKEKIQTEFANLVNNESNLRVEGNVDNGAAIMKYLKTTDQKKDTNITKTTSKETINGFLEVLKKQVEEISNKLVSNYPELKPLFNGINPNDILKVNTDNLNTMLTSKAFDWETNDFDLKDYDPDNFGITDWYYLNANLTLDFTFLDETAKSTTSTISQSYDMYFANDGSNLSNIVNAVTANIKEKLDKIKFVKLEYTAWDDSFVNKKATVLHDINIKLSNNLSSIRNLNIDTQEIDNPNHNDYNYMSEKGWMRYDSLTLTRAEDHIKNSTDFNNAWNPVIATRETNFAKRLDLWKNKWNLQIDNPENVFVFSEYKTTNWKISGLEIKEIPVPYYITSKDTTRASNTSESLEILERLFVGDDALFKYGKNWTPGDSYTRMNFSFNPSDYDDFINKDVTIQKIYDYVTKQTINAVKKDGITIPDDKIKWTTGINPDLLNKKVSEVLKLENGFMEATKSGNINNFLNWRLVINGNAFSMSSETNSDFNSGNTYFSFNKATNDVWPPLPN